MSGVTVYQDERRRPRPRRGPLAGIRVADFCWMGVGSVATRLLADFGAEVIKIEDRTRIDTPRKLPLYKGEQARNFGEEVVGADPHRGGSSASRSTCAPTRAAVSPSALSPRARW